MESIDQEFISNLAVASRAAADCPRDIENIDDEPLLPEVRINQSAIVMRFTLDAKY